ncbi:alpha/beta hydrolase [Ureibacillus acetophenoni]
MWKWEAEGQPKAVVVIVHSAFEHHRWYAWLIEKLRVDGCHVVMGDLPGHGEESKYTRIHDETLNEYINYIHGMMQSALTYELPVYLIGHGLGGTLAVQYLKKHKVECAGIILSSPWFALQKLSNTLKSTLANLGSLTSNMKLSLDINKKALTNSLQGYQEIDDELVYKTHVTVSWYKEIQLLMKNLTTPATSQLSIPILLMTAKKDKITEIDQARKWLLLQTSSEFQFKEWPFSYHNLFHDMEREQVFLYIRDFINNTTRGIGYIVE